MILCLCNGISDRHVREQAAAGASRASEIYDRLGAKPRCGQCVPHVRAALRQASDRPAGAGDLPAAVPAE